MFVWGKESTEINEWTLMNHHGRCTWHDQWMSPYRPALIEGSTLLVAKEPKAFIRLLRFYENEKSENRYSRFGENGRRSSEGIGVNPRAYSINQGYILVLVSRNIHSNWCTYIPVAFNACSMSVKGRLKWSLRCSWRFSNEQVIPTSMKDEGTRNQLRMHENQSMGSSCYKEMLGESNYTEVRVSFREFRTRCSHYFPNQKLEKFHMGCFHSSLSSIYRT